MSTKANPPSPSRIRLTISVPAHVHEAYRQMAEASGRSISSEMADWLDSTLDAAERMGRVVAKAREEPRKAVQRLAEHIRALETYQQVVDEQRVEAQRPSRQAEGTPLAGSGGVAGRHPPASNTGGKGAKTHAKGAR